MSLLHIIFHGPIKLCCNVSRARPGAGRGSGRSTTVRAIHPMLRGKAAPMPGVEDLWTKPFAMRTATLRRCRARAMVSGCVGERGTWTMKGANDKGVRA
jgi:hypothetical protein